MNKENNFSLKSQLPKQKMSPFSTNQSSNTGSSSSVNLLTGGQDEYGHGNFSQQADPDMDNFTPEQRAIRTVHYSQNTSDHFFSERQFVKSFGVTSVMRCRMGLDMQNKIFKMFICKQNINSRPSVIGIIHQEIPALIEYFEDCLHQIDEGYKNKVFAFKLDDETAKLKITDRDFWWTPDVVSLESGTVRMRCIHKVGRFYNWVLNCPQDNSSYSNYFGPRITIIRQEVIQLIELLKNALVEHPLTEEGNSA